MQTLKKILFLLSLKERKRAGLLLIMIIIMTLLDTIGIASILPFVTIISNPSLIETNIFLNLIFQSSSIFGVEKNEHFFFALGFLVFLLLIISIFFRAFTIYVQTRFTHMCEYSIGKRLIEGYLHQPYSWFLSRNSADLGKNILSEVATLIANGIHPFIELIAKGCITISIIILLVLVDPKLTVIVSLSLGISYLLIFSFLRSYLSRSGEERLKSNRLRYTFVSEAFWAAKEIKAGGLEKIYIKNFSDSAKNFSRTQITSSIISLLPRFLLEIITFGGALLIILYKMSETGNFNDTLPIISLYVFAGYRLIPAIQQIYSCLTALTFAGPSLDKLYEDFKNLKPFKESQYQNVLPLNNKIDLKNISYNYPNQSVNALNNINLTIHAKSVVGFVGVTGSGKTTIVDIILGLLEAQKGTLEVDGMVITRQNLRSWQKSIGYVPQNIYLADDTIAANIAFGVKTDDINLDLIERAAKTASLHDFVINDLPEQYQTTIGERGVRLSGGQRQRIGIARALYSQPTLLILDEATNALDIETEKIVMESINKLKDNITIILIAHRLNTVKNCNQIFLVENGKITVHSQFEKKIEITGTLNKLKNIIK